MSFKANNADLRCLHAAAYTLATLVVAGAAWCSPCRQNPELSNARVMLAALPQEEQDVREAAVESTLVRMPGAGETFLSALMSWGYLSAGTADPGLGGLPYAHSEYSTYNSRQWGYTYANPVTVAVGRSSFRTSGLCFTSPLILDLDGDSEPSVSGGTWEPHVGLDLNGSWVLFDIDGDGYQDLTEWVGPADGLLIGPENALSVGSNEEGDLTWTGPLCGRDLLGSAGGFLDGFEKLAQLYDLNQDRIVSGSEFAGLYVWRDLNQDAAIQPGELDHPHDLSVAALRLPDAGSCIGAFDHASGQGFMWDWWPSYLQGYRLWSVGSTEPPSVVPLIDLPLPDLAYLGESLPIGPDFWIDAAALAAAGVDFPSVRLVGLSPDGNWLVVQDRTPDPAGVAAGLVRRLWILPRPRTTGNIVPRIVPVPATDIMQFVFADEGTAFLVTDNGGSLLQLDLASGALARVHAHHVGEAGLRFSGRAFWSPQGACFSGWFHNAELASQHEAIMMYTDAMGAPSLVEVANHENVLAGVEHLGVVVGEIAVGPEFYHFVVRTESGGSLLVVSREGVVTVADDNVLPHGLAGSGDRVLYFRKTVDQAVPEVRVFDALSGESCVLGAGDYCYPYLADAGNIAYVTSIDWQAKTLTMWRGQVVPGCRLQPVLVTAGIGAVRVSENGQLLAYLGPDGLYWGAMTTTGIESETSGLLRLNQNSPNPFNPLTSIKYDVPTNCRVTLRVYDVRGALVCSLIDADLPRGTHQSFWDGRDASGRGMASGSYFARLEAGGKVETVRMSLVR